MKKVKITVPQFISTIILNKNGIKSILLKNNLNGQIIDLKIGRKINIQLKNNVYTLFFNKKYKKFYKSFFTIMKNSIEDLIFYYKDTFFLKGSGFKVKLSKNKRYLLFLLGFSHVTYFRVPFNVFINKVNLKDNSVECFSTSRQVLYEFISKVKKLKTVNIYKGKGIFISNEKVILKKPKSLEKK